MLKVLIVDDEAIFRLGIRSSVAWEKLDCIVCGEASNGEEAIKMIFEKHPDIVFLDIKMPVLDGIGVLRKMSGHCSDIFYVVLSCFNEYEYVREAMKLGAYDYLFKPVMGVKELTDIVKEIRDRSISMKKSEAEKERVSILQKLEILKRGALFEMTEEDKQRFALLDQTMSEQPFLAVGIQMIKDGTVVKSDSPTADICKTIIMQNMDDEDFYFISLEENSMLMMLNFGQRVKSFSKKKCQDEWQKMISGISGYTECEIHVGIGNIGLNLDSYYRCVSEAVAACKNYFFTNEEVNFFRQDWELSYDFEKIYENIFGEIQDALSQKDLGRIYELLRFLKKDILLHKYYNIHDYCHFLAANMIAFMRKYQGGRILETLLLEDYNLISNIYHQVSIDRANEEFLRVIQICFQEVHGISVPRIQETMVETAIRYIQENYMNKISLDEIATHIHINKNYFCKIFKQETGINLVNYITELRLDKATELLNNTDKKIYEIAEEVGFQSYPYFCRTYKKYRNISPTEVKRK